MPDVSDMDLVREYCARQSERAFETLVHRHINLVYSTALRQVGNPAQAEEITQAVFVILARKAVRLRPDAVLAAWLHETARYAAASYLRGEIRRRRREQEAYMQSTLRPSSDDSAWEQLAPLLDEAIGRLRNADRNVVVLRYFQNKSAREIAAVLNIREAAAKKRLTRAVEKLRLDFFKRGINVPAGALSGAVLAHSVQAAPATLAKTVTAVAVAKGATAPISTLTLIKGALNIMAWAKAKTVIVAGAGLLLVAGTATVTINKIKAFSTDESWRVLNLNPEIVEKAAPQVRILPTKFAGSGGAASYTDYKFAAVGKSVDDIARIAYDVPPARIIFTAAKPRGGYDYIANFPQGSRQALQQELNKQFGLIGRPEMRAMDSLLLRVRNPNAPGLKPSTSGPGFLNNRVEHGRNYITCNNLPLVSIRNLLEQYFNQPVIDETGLTQNFSFELQWNDLNGRNANHSGLKQALLNQLGLELVPTNMPIEMLVMEKAK